MKSVAAAALAGAALAGFAEPAAAQVGNPASPRVGAPQSSSQIGPPAPIAPRVPPVGTVPSSLSLPQALEEAAARSPTIIAAEADVAAAEARIRQAGYRENPELSLEVENFGGTGELSGIQSMEATLAVNHRLDLGGRRGARVNAARAELAVQRLRLQVARADLFRSVREQFARAAAARERVAQADETVDWAHELVRVTRILVEAGRDPPLRAVRARSALAQAQAAQMAQQADELAARSSLAGLLGVSTPVGAISGSSLDLSPREIATERILEVQLAGAERAAAAAALQQQLAERRLDPAVGAGVRHVRETGDFGFVAGISMPLRVFDRNRGNIEAARAALAAAEARRASTLATSSAQARNAIAAVEAAERRVDALERSALPEASEALRLALRSFEEGRATLLELLDAQDAYTGAQTTLTDARLDLALATAELGRLSAQ